MRTTFSSLVYTNLKPDYLNKSVPPASTPPVEFNSTEVPEDIKLCLGLEGDNHAYIQCKPKYNGSLAIFLTPHLPMMRTGQTLYLNKNNEIETVTGEGPIQPPVQKPEPATELDVIG